MSKDLTAITEALADNSSLQKEVVQLRQDILELRTRNGVSPRSYTHNGSAGALGADSYAAAVGQVSRTTVPSSIPGPAQGQKSTVRERTPPFPISAAPPHSNNNLDTVRNDQHPEDSAWQIPTRRHRMARLAGDTQSTPSQRTCSTTFTKERVTPRADTIAGAERVRRSAIYVGGVDPGCTAQAIASWCTDRSVDVLSCSVSESRYFGTAYAHLLVPKSQESVVIDEEFWPSKVTARLWRFKADAQQEATEQSNSPGFDSMTNSTSS